MSRVPQTPTRSPLKQPLRTPTTPTSRSRTGTPCPNTPRTRTKSVPNSASRPSTSKASHEDEPVPKAALSIREAIALRRAEAKKTASKGAGSGLDNLESLDDALPVFTNKKADDDLVELGRWSLRETIERARTTGSLNISTRTLPCLPSALFEIHLDITPDPLKSVPNEPTYPASVNPTGSSRRVPQRDRPSWFETQDLHVLKAWSNDIVEIQHEISLFGSLKIVDLHQNKIESLPETFADLTQLTSLDLSHNRLKVIPSNLFALPSLTILNLSHNELSSLPFDAPFSNPNSKSRSKDSGSFFAPVIVRSSMPLPCLVTLDVSHNKILASAIDHNRSGLPFSLSKFDLSFNPLGTGDPKCRSFIQALSRLAKLKELLLEGAEIGDVEFTPDLFSSSSTPDPFPALTLLDLGKTKITRDAAEAALRHMKRSFSFYVTTENPPEGTVRIIVGEKVIKETWELEAERRVKARQPKSQDLESGSTRQSAKECVKEVIKEPWEIEAEQGLLTEGGRRRARAAAAAYTPKYQDTGNQPVPKERVIVKEPWEIEAEQGLLTEGGRRKARMAAAAKSTVEDKKPPSSPEKDNSGTPTLTLSNPQYYTPATQTLTLPSSTPSKAHSRAISIATPKSFWSSASAPVGDITLPTSSLPLALIATQPFAEKLKILILANRRMDRSFDLPPLADGVTVDGPWLPNLEELSLEGCGLGDMVPVTRQESSSSGAITPSRSNEFLLPLLTSLFPSIRTLDLSYNTLTNASIKTAILSSLILSSDDPSGISRKGLRHLRLRGNKITELEGLQGISQLFKGNRDVPDWKLEELDLRDNEIGKLPPELGLMPLDVFLVDGNLFRVPQRRVWEREGTKGLLSWLRGRIE